MQSVTSIKHVVLVAGAIVMIVSLGYSMYTGIDLMVIPTLIACVLLTSSVAIDLHEAYVRTSTQSMPLRIWQITAYTVIALTLVLAVLQLSGITPFAEWNLAVILVLVMAGSLMTVVVRGMLRSASVS